MQAVIAIGGRQYRVKVGDIITIPGPSLQEECDKILYAVNDDGSIILGKPYIPDSKVLFSIENTYKGEKVIVFKKKRRKGYKKKIGYRPILTDLKVKKIIVKGVEYS